ncbi:MAG: type 4a pilus biogenesis protein PilO [Candidatus Omnitrophica bacterium]|nr:type 4a pilus biogenesis protein PilO [Candidatus Omnitrophota bacterium]
MEDFLRDIRKDKQKLIAVVVAFAVIVYVDVSFVLKGQVKALSVTKANVAKLNTDIQAVKRDVAIVQQNQSKEKSNLKIKKLVSEGELLSLLEQVSRIAKDNAVRVSQINPQKAARPPEKAGQKQSAFISVLIKLDLNCNYHNLGTFINDIENSEYAVSCEDIRIVPDSSSGARERVMLTLKTYVKS